MRVERLRLATGLAVAAALLAAVTLTGCAPEARPSTVVREPESPQDVLTPRERGQLRTEVVETARGAWDAFVAMDTEAMAPYFTPAMVDQYAELYAGYERDGRERRRVYEVTHFDAITMTDDGSQAEILVKLVDNSYFVEADGTRTVPTGEERDVTLMMERGDDGAYRVTRIFAAREFLE